MRLHLLFVVVIGLITGPTLAGPFEPGTPGIARSATPLHRPLYNCIPGLEAVFGQHRTFDLPKLGVEPIYIRDRFPNLAEREAFFRQLEKDGTEVIVSIKEYSRGEPRLETTRIHQVSSESAYSLVMVGLNESSSTNSDVILWIRNADSNSGPTIDKAAEEKFERRTTIEVELPISNTALKMLTTTNGKLSGFLGDFPPPDWLALWAKKRRLGAVTDIPWERLNGEQQVKLIEYVSQRRGLPGADFDSAAIEGLRVKKSMGVTLTKPAVIFGKQYPKGTHEIPLTQFHEIVEFAGPDFIVPFSGIELHYSDTRTAKEVFTEVDRFLKTVKLSALSRHAHQPERAPVKHFESLKLPRQYLLSFFGSEMTRRFNLFAEIEGLMARGLLAKKKFSRDGQYTVFSYASRNHFLSMVRWFYNVMNGSLTEDNLNFKSLFVGIRPPATYSSQDGRPLIGSEYRAIPKDVDPERMGDILMAMRKKLADSRFGADEPQMEEWLTSRGYESGSGSLDDLGKFVAAECPHHSDLATERVQIRSLFSSEPDRDWFLQMQETRQALLSHLTHDWSTDPLLWKNETQLLQIEALQDAALEQVMAIDRAKPQVAIDKEINAILKSFHAKAGIHRLLEQWLGLPPNTKS